MKLATPLASLCLITVLAGFGPVAHNEPSRAPPTAPPSSPSPSNPPAQTAPSDGSAPGPKPGDSGGWPPSQTSSLGIGQAAPAFAMQDTEGNSINSAALKGSVVVLMWVNPECPTCIGKMKDGSVAKMMTAAKDVNKDAKFFFINSTASMADKPSKSKEFLTSNSIAAPAVVDGEGAVARAFAAINTPHCFVIDAKGVLVYAGAMDEKDKSANNYVVNAVKALKDSKQPTPAITPTYGTAVKLKTS